MLAIDTDGIDGSEDNAGALFSPEDWAHARTRDIDPVDYLSRNDAYTFFQVLNDLIVTGPTWTNVNDLRALLILPSTHDPHRRIRIVAIPGQPATMKTSWKRSPTRANISPCQTHAFCIQ